MMPFIINHRDFSYWLLSRVSPSRSAIELESGDVLALYPDVVNKVLGIPSVGLELEVPSMDVIGHVKKSTAERLNVVNFKDINKELLEDVLEKPYVGGMSKDEKDAFKTAFLMLVMMKFLAPQSNMDNKCPRYFSALLDPNDISKFNWSAYVLNEILDAATVVQKKIADGTKCGYITGCGILLQVYYLDNVDFGDLSLNNNVFPRIALYDRDVIKERYQLDTSARNTYQATKFGKLKLRPKKDVCYHRISEITNLTDIQGKERNSASVQVEAQHAAEILQKAQELKSFWISCIGNLDKATESLVKVTEASKSLPSMNAPMTNAYGVSEEYTCTMVNDEAEKGTEVDQTPYRGKDVEDASKYGANCTLIVLTESTTKESIDLNRTVPHRTYTGLDFDLPSFDLNIDFSPSKNTATPVSLRSISQDVAAASLDHLQGIYIENSKGELSLNTL